MLCKIYSFCLSTEAGTELKGASMQSLQAGEAGAAGESNDTQTHLLQSMLSLGAEEAQQQQEAGTEII